MVRPLKDIVAELEGNYIDCQLPSLEERAHIIRDYDASIEYLLKQMDDYIQEVNYTLEHKLSVSIISRITQNLIFQIAHSHDLMIPYSFTLGVYLMDERYDENYRFWKEFGESGDKLLTLIGKLKENDVFVLEDIEKEAVLLDLHIIHGFGGKIPSKVKQGMKLAYSNGAKLLTCLEYMIDMMEDELASMKMTQIMREDDELLKEDYEINYLLYAKTYWPIRERSFRPHITNQLLRNKVTINGLEELRRETVRDFENNTGVGKIWRDYSEDVASMAKQLKDEIKSGDEWKYFFQEVFELEEYDRWIEELRNPPETEEDRQKRARLLRSNKIFNLQPANQKKGIDILLLYQFIDTRFISELKANYEWYALYYVLKKNGILKVRLAEDFAKQMNHEEWFPNVGTKCRVKAIKDYEFLEEAEPGHWVVNIRKTSGAGVSKKSIDTIQQRYEYLTDCLDEIFAEETSMVKEGYTIINYGTYNDVHDNKTVKL